MIDQLALLHCYAINYRFDFRLGAFLVLASLWQSAGFLLSQTLQGGGCCSMWSFSNCSCQYALPWSQFFPVLPVLPVFPAKLNGVAEFVWLEASLDHAQFQDIDVSKGLRNTPGAPELSICVGNVLGGHLSSFSNAQGVVAVAHGFAQKWSYTQKRNSMWNIWENDDQPWNSVKKGIFRQAHSGPFCLPVLDQVNFPTVVVSCNILRWHGGAFTAFLWTWRAMSSCRWGVTMAHNQAARLFLRST